MDKLAQARPEQLGSR